MLRVIIIFCVFSQAKLEKQIFPLQVNHSRKSRSNEDPINTGIVHNKADDDRGKINIYDNMYLKPTEKYEAMKVKEDDNKMEKNNVTTKINATECHENWETRIKDAEVHLSPKRNDDYLKAKTKCLQLAGKSELNPNEMKQMFTPYTVENDFIIDNEDVRTDSRNTYNGWPYSYNGPYKYQKNVNAKNEKAKDKRFLGVHTTIKPKGKNLIENNSGEYISNAASFSDPVIDNPIYGDQPFFSFVLNDYFDRHHEEDPVMFKDFPWGEEFDNGLSSQDIEDNERRSRRLHENNKPNAETNKKTTKYHKNAAEKSYDGSREYEKYRRGGDKENNQKLNHDYKGQREKAFKEFVDSFANKFGTEESNRNSKYTLNSNQDKGQKRKGFKRVYHKDEYQEDNEFYDNINKNAQSEENGGSSFNSGASHSFVQSKAGGAAGNEANSLAKIGNKDYKIFGNHYDGNEKNIERDNEINHYRNIAKDAAVSNNADYVDDFRI